MVNSLPSCRGYFEPLSVHNLTLEAGNSVTKLVLDAHEQTIDLDVLARFDKRIVLLRDPRDRLISSLLFGLHGKTQTNLDRIINLLHKKETNANTYPFVSLVLDIYPHMREKDLLQRVHKTHDLINPLTREPNNLITIKYEALMNSDFVKLENYLDICISESVEVPDHHAYGKRISSTQQWKYWFTEADVKFFSPIMNPILELYGYDEDWVLTPQPYIAKAECTQFVLRAREQKEYFARQNTFWNDG